MDGHQEFERKLKSPRLRAEAYVVMLSVPPIDILIKPVIRYFDTILTAYLQIFHPNKFQSSNGWISFF